MCGFALLANTFFPGQAVHAVMAEHCSVTDTRTFVCAFKRRMQFPPAWSLPRSAVMANPGSLPTCI